MIVGGRMVTRENLEALENIMGAHETPGNVSMRTVNTILGEGWARLDQSITTGEWEWSITEQGRAVYIATTEVKVSERDL